MSLRDTPLYMAVLNSTCFPRASLTVFQIPHATDVPATHFFATLTTCRALAGLIYAPIFFLYFSSEMTRSVHFAILWSQVCKNRILICIIDDSPDAGTKTDTLEPLDNVVPSRRYNSAVSGAISPCPPFGAYSESRPSCLRALIFLVLTIISFLWQTADPALSELPPAMPTSLAPVLQGVLLTAVVFDTAGLCWILVSLGRYKKACLDRMSNSREGASA